jgi:hypothetical protein
MHNENQTPFSHAWPNILYKWFWRRWKGLKRINWLHVLFKADFCFQPLDFNSKAINHSHHSHISLSFSYDMASIYIYIFQTRVYVICYHLPTSLLSLLFINKETITTVFLHSFIHSFIHSLLINKATLVTTTLVTTEHVIKKRPQGGPGRNLAGLNRISQSVCSMC